MRTLLLTCFFLAATAAAHAQKTIRIYFPTGGSKSTVYGQMNGYADSNQYVVPVEAGKTFSVEQYSSSQRKHPVSLTVHAPGGSIVSGADASCNSSKSIPGTVAGEYIVRVVECRKAEAWNGAYRLRFTVK